MFTGSIVALVTPMHEDGAIDWAAYDRLLQFHVDQRSDGLVIGGTTGESPTLTGDELARLVTRAKEFLGGRMPVIAGSGGNSTAKTVELSRAMQAAGADGLLVVTPYYNRPPQEGLRRHFLAVAEAVSIPLILYNVPSRTGVDLLPETVVRLSAHERIVAVKEATGIIERCGQILHEARPGFSVLSGDDPSFLRLMKAGATGVISVTANVTARKIHDLCVAALGRDWATADALDAELQPLNAALSLEVNPIPVKWAVARLGLMGDGIRLPLTPLQPQFKERILAALGDGGIGFA